MRFPLPLVPDEIGIKGAFFVDAGSLFGVSKSTQSLNNTVDNITGKTIQIVDESAVRVSAGTSLIWDSPLGPLRADFGWALKKEQYDQLQLFRFGASTKF